MMISVEEAKALIKKNIKPNPVITIGLDDVLGKTLAQKIISREPSPSFDASSVDGYAVTVQDFEHSGRIRSLPVTAEIAAGDNARHFLKRGETMRIFTGAQVPAGADAVVMQEFVTRKKGMAHFQRFPKPEQNIRRRGDEFKVGAAIFEKGTLITPAVLSTLAALGYANVKVYASARVSLIISGNEIRKPGEKLERGEIYDSNSFALRAALKEMNVDHIQAFHVKDDLKKTRAVIERGLQDSDMLIIAGGVSVGDHDLVREALFSLGAKEVFWKVNVKPGKPMLFMKVSGKSEVRSRKLRKYIFGLPGNPVSALVTFHLFVRDAIMHMMGCEINNLDITATLGADIKKTSPRREYLRAKLSFEDNHFIATPLREQESNMTSGLAKADCLIDVSEGEVHWKAGEKVRILQLR